MRRIFIEEEFAPTITITGPQAHHLLYAMRTSPGTKYTLVDSNNHVAIYEVNSCTKDSISLSLIEELPDSNTESPLYITLAQGLPKGDKMEMITQKAVELGVNEIIPLELTNCVVKYDAAKAAKKESKWQKIADEAAKQSGRTSKMRVLSKMSLSDLLESYLDAAILLCYEKKEPHGLVEELAKIDNDNLVVIIGPEGGFTPEEVELCQSYANVHIVSLGPRILRTETAALALVSILQYAKGDI